MCKFVSVPPPCGNQLKEPIKTGICCFCISNETLKLGLAKWQVPEEIII